MKTLIKVSALALALSSPLAQAQSSEQVEGMSPLDQKEMIGLGSGALIGAAAGGPLGAIIGGVFGIMVGQMDNAKTENKQLSLALGEQMDSYQQLALENQVLLNKLGNAHPREHKQTLSLVNYNSNNDGEYKGQNGDYLPSSLSLSFQFRTGKNTVEPFYLSQIEQLSEYIKYHDNLQVVLNGYSDSRGSVMNNLNLSMARINSIKDYLIEQGISEERISSKAFGESKPLVQESSLENDFFERRVVLTLTRADKYIAAN